MIHGVRPTRFPIVPLPAMPEKFTAIVVSSLAPSDPQSVWRKKAHCSAPPRTFHGLPVRNYILHSQCQAQRNNGRTVSLFYYGTTRGTLTVSEMAFRHSFPRSAKHVRGERLLLYQKVKVSLGPQQRDVVYTGCENPVNESGAGRRG